MLYKIGLIIMAVLYIAAGVNHFINPRAYFKLIPPYLPNPIAFNYAAGFAEIIGGILLFFPVTRSFAAWGIIAMLIAFLPAHIYMIQKAPMNMGIFVITPFIAWIRLPLQLLLMYWAYSFTK
jgi:uncharacterized membrane protein